jgi:hypothetical protein
MKSPRRRVSPELVRDIKSLKARISRKLKSIENINKKSRKNSPRRKSPSTKCKQILRKKIGINMDEYKKGRFVSPKQAIAVSYSQARRDYGCKL